MKEDEIYKDVRVIQKRTLNIILIFIGMTVLICFTDEAIKRSVKLPEGMKASEDRVCRIMKSNLGPAGKGTVQ